MARQLRVEYAGAIYHVTVRSNGGEALFASDVDRRYLLARIAEAREMYYVRVYLFCLMVNHFHLVVETPRANLGRFMQGVLTGYGVYFNRAHRRHGHVTQGRYGAKLVEGDEYLLKLSRYVHLNPVNVVGMESMTQEERTAYLRKYPWSSFQGYTGIGLRNEFVDYGPLLALVGGRSSDQAQRYQVFVESGMAGDNEEFLAAMVRSVRSIGSDKFREQVDARYRELVGGRRVVEDVAFRRAVNALSVEQILQTVAAAAKLKPEALTVRRRDSRWRAVASRMLCRHGGLSQRDAAALLGVKTGVAVSCQNKKLTCLLQVDKKFAQAVRGVELRLDQQRKRQR